MAGLSAHRHRSDIRRRAEAESGSLAQQGQARVLHAGIIVNIDGTQHDIPARFCAYSLARTEAVKPSRLSAGSEFPDKPCSTCMYLLRSECRQEGALVCNKKRNDQTWRYRGKVMMNRIEQQPRVSHVINKVIMSESKSSEVL
jgi:hypothetical protein